jgi:hypothetical protein
MTLSGLQLPHAATSNTQIHIVPSNVEVAAVLPMSTLTFRSTTLRMFVQGIFCEVIAPTGSRRKLKTTEFQCKQYAIAPNVIVFRLLSAYLPRQTRCIQCSQVSELSTSISLYHCSSTLKTLNQ